MTLNVTLNGGYYGSNVASLMIAKAKILYDGYSLARETQSECLYLLGGVLFGEAGEAEVGLPL